MGQDRHRPDDRDPVRPDVPDPALEPEGGTACDEGAREDRREREAVVERRRPAVKARRVGVPCPREVAHDDQCGGHGRGDRVRAQGAGVHRADIVAAACASA